MAAAVVIAAHAKASGGPGHVHAIGIDDKVPTDGVLKQGVVGRQQGDGSFVPRLATLTAVGLFISKISESTFLGLLADTDVVIRMMST